MSYYAKMKGEIVFKDGVTRGKINEAINYAIDHFAKMRVVDDHDVLSMEIMSYRNYNEDYFREFFEKMNGMVESGCLDFCGEDVSIWRLIFNEEEEAWEQQDGYIEYGDPQPF